MALKRTQNELRRAMCVPQATSTHHLSGIVAAFGRPTASTQALPLQQRAGLFERVAAAAFNLIKSARGHLFEISEEGTDIAAPQGQGQSQGQKF